MSKVYIRHTTSIQGGISSCRGVLCCTGFLLSRCICPHRLTYLSPLLLYLCLYGSPSEPPTCRNGLVGVGSSGGLGKFCCDADCGVCGGPGCSTVAVGLGLNEHDCCTAAISADGELCSEKMEAPCIIEGSTCEWRCCCSIVGLALLIDGGKSTVLSR